MAERVVPMIHVPNVRATAQWYQDRGFSVHRSFGQPIPAR